MTHYKGISAENANFVSKDTGNMTPSVKLTTQLDTNITPAGRFPYAGQVRMWLNYDVLSWCIARVQSRI